MHTSSRLLMTTVLAVAATIVNVSSNDSAIANELAPNDDSPGADPALVLPLLEGSWKVKKITADGKEIADREVSGSTMTFDDGEFIWKSGNSQERFTVKPEKAGKPMAIQVHRVEPKRKQEGVMIFERHGDRLKIAFYDALQGRPKSFEPDEELLVLEMERVENKE